MNKPEIEKIKIEMDPELTVRRANNGFITNCLERLTSEENENVYGREENVFEDHTCGCSDDDDLELLKLLEPADKSMYYLLHYIKDFFGCFYSKHNKANIVITIEGKSEEDGPS